MAEGALRRKLLEVMEAVQTRVDLSQAEIIVAGGRGLGSKEKFQLILDLASALGAGVGASRPVTDGGWLPKEHQIGSSGQTVTPRLYIACGISGAIQHLVGMSNAGCIVAINKDPPCPHLPGGRLWDRRGRLSGRSQVDRDRQGNAAIAKDRCHPGFP